MMLSFIQKRVGIAVGLITISLSLLSLIDLHFFYGLNLFVALKSPSVWGVLLTGIILLSTGFYIKSWTKVLQFFIIFFNGLFSALDASPSDLTSIIWVGLGYLLALEYGLLDKRLKIKSILLVVAYLVPFTFGQIKQQKTFNLLPFHALVGLAMAVYLAWVLILVRNKRHEEREVILEQEVKARTVSIEIRLTEIKQLKDKLEDSLNEKELLLKEVHHRTKNNMQLISSIISLEKENVPDVGTQQVLEKIKDRIYILSLTHELTYQSENIELVNAGLYFRSIIASISGDILPSEINCQVDIPPDLTISVNLTIPIGLIVYELVRNAGLHAFRTRKSGRLTLSVVNKNKLLIINIIDDGIGMPAAFDLSRQNTLGLQLVKNLADQTKGTISMVRPETGTKWVLEIPIKAT